MSSAKNQPKTDVENGNALDTPNVPEEGQKSGKAPEKGKTSGKNYEEWKIEAIALGDGKYNIEKIRKIKDVKISDKYADTLNERAASTKVMYYPIK